MVKDVWERLKPLAVEVPEMVEVEARELEYRIQLPYR